MSARTASTPSDAVTFAPDALSCSGPLNPRRYGSYSRREGPIFCIDSFPGKAGRFRRSWCAAQTVGWGSSSRLAQQKPPRARLQRSKHPKQPRRSRKPTARRARNGLPIAGGRFEARKRLRYGARHRGRPSNVEPCDQRVLLDEHAPGLDVVAHQLGEDLVCGDPVFDLYFEQTPRLRIHRSLPKLFRIHLSQALVALDRGAALDFSQQPLHGLRKIGDPLFLVLALDHGAGPEEALQQLRDPVELLVVSRRQKVLVEHARSDISVVGPLDDQLVALVLAIIARAYIDPIPFGCHSLLKAERAGSRRLRVRKIDLSAAHERSQGLDIDDLRGSRHHCLGK